MAVRTGTSKQKTVQVTVVWKYRDITSMELVLEPWGVPISEIYQSGSKYYAYFFGENLEEEMVFDSLPEAKRQVLARMQDETEVENKVKRPRGRPRKVR